MQLLQQNISLILGRELQKSCDIVSMFLLTQFDQDADLDIGEVLLEEGLQFVFAVTEDEGEEVVGFVYFAIIQILLDDAFDSEITSTSQI